MEQEKKQTVTIGIPAHNEAENLPFMLESVLRQQGENIRIEKIVVLSDGSTDGTEAVAREFALRFPIVECLADGERKGKIMRLNELCRMNRSDFLVFLDADIVFESDTDLAEMIRTFGDDPAINVVAAHEIPVQAETFVGRVNVAGSRLWDETRLFVNGGNHIHNLRGSASALRKSFADTIVYPVKLTTDASFLYLKANEHDPHGFRYAYRSHVLFRAPDTLMECRLQGTRAIIQQKEHVSKYFGDWVFEKYRIPVPYKVRAVAKMLLLNPVMTVLSVLLGLYVRTFPLRDDMAKRYTWKMVSSTKRAIEQAIPAYRMTSVYQGFKK